MLTILADPNSTLASTIAARKEKVENGLVMQINVPSRGTTLRMKAN